MKRVPYLRLVEPTSPPEIPDSCDKDTAELVFTILTIFGRALRLAIWLALGLIVGIAI